ncbi:acyl-CoA thioesterase [Haliangium sp. UPWRP_2]|uniref:acyl-CoA thioesterase n=1 Tax=Haliangium sp. UPWRP_2 TaxID=1931276 RepID=UPI0018EDE77D|nr:acyl-CoA thioesterase [Haliangium sp. UPWRP_2]HNN92253.1 acyl-CoA thioesterase [Pseudomonadota bacterium]
MTALEGAWYEPTQRPMARVELVKLQVYFSDCDPLGIAGQSSYFRWYDAASRIYFERCGVPPWRELEKSRGIIGTPLLEVASQFFDSLDPGDPIEIETSIVRWEPKVFTQRHVLYRHGQRHAEGEEKRVFASRDPQTGRVYAIPIPDDIRASCQ